MNSLCKILIYPFRYKISVIKSILFNLHYFPLAIAVKLPIIIYKHVRIRKTRGEIVLDSQKIKTGMVHIGKKTYGFQHRYDFTIWEQHGGTVIFGDDISIGKGTFITIGKNATLCFKRNTHFGGDDRIICMKSVTIKSNTIAAWDVTIIDTDFRPTINTIFNTRNTEKKAITIGENNWLCFGSTILKGSVTPDFCIVGANTTINRDFDNEGESIVIASGSDAKVIIRNIQYDPSFASKETDFRK